jgi:streptomycin 6-kinase
MAASTIAPTAPRAPASVGVAMPAKIGLEIALLLEKISENIHEKEIIHHDIHSGNILQKDEWNSYIIGLC